MGHIWKRAYSRVSVYVIRVIQYTLTTLDVGVSVYRILIQYTLTSLGVGVSVYLILILRTQTHIWKVCLCVSHLHHRKIVPRFSALVALIQRFRPITLVDGTIPQP